jgi:hypothetical protein
MASIGVLMETASALAKVGAAAAGTVVAVGLIASSLAKLNNPTVAKQLELAFGDMMATLGEMLVPLVSALIPVFKQMGGALAAMQPVLEPIIEVVTEIMEMLGMVFVETLRMLAPILSVLGAVLKVLMIPLRITVGLFVLVARVISYVANAIIDTINLLIDAINHLHPFEDIGHLGRAKFEEGIPDITGKKVRQTSTMSAEDMGQRIREGAFGATAVMLQQLQAQKEAVQALKQIQANTASSNTSPRDDARNQALSTIGGAGGAFGALNHMLLSAQIPHG